MSGNSAVRRLQKDYAQIIKDPVPYLTATPHPSNILEWYAFQLMSRDWH